MSDCEHIQKLIDRYINSLTSKSEFEEIEEHIAICSICREDFETVRAIKLELDEHKFEDEPVFDNFRPEFHEKLFSLAGENESNQKKNSIVQLPFLNIKVLSSVAAALIIFISITYYLDFNGKEKGHGSGTLISSSEVEVDKPVEIILEYVAEKNIQDVKVNFNLDNGVAFYTSYSKLNSIKKHVWKGDLKKGVNKIPFVVNIVKKGIWEINTKADFEGFSHIHKIVLEANEKIVRISYYKMQKIKLNNAL